MKPWSVPLALAVMLVTGCAGRLSPTAPVRPDQGIHTVTVQTPIGSVEVSEQRFGPASDQYPWDLDLSRQVSEEMRSRFRSDLLPPVPSDPESVNDTLKRFDYSLKPMGTDPGDGYDLYRSDKLVLPDIPPAMPVVVLNEFGDDVAFVVRVRGGTVLVRRQGISWGDWAPDFPPVFVGRDLVALKAQYPSGHPFRDQPIPWSVWREGKTVFTLQVPENGANPRVKRLAAWAGNWVLEVDGNIYIDGSAVASEIGARRVFEWRLINGNPFYFVEKDNRVSPSYGGYLLPLRYDEVVHYRCCEPAMYNPGSTETSVGFWGRRSRSWYFVVVGSV